MAVSSPRKLWVAGERCLGWVMLLGVPVLLRFGRGGGCRCDRVTHDFSILLGWRQRCQEIFVPWNTPWGDFVPMPAKEHQPSWEPPGSCREQLGGYGQGWRLWAWTGLGMLHLALN